MANDIMSRRRGFFASNEGLRNLRAKMTEMGYTQEELASEATVNITQVQRLLNPQWNKKLERNTISKIARALDLQPTDIVLPDEWNYPSRGDSEQRQIPTDGQSDETHSARVLISYRTQEPDHSLAQHLGEGLKTAGKEVFMGRDNEADWPQRFNEELEKCDCLVLLLSAQAAVSEMVTEELRRASELRAARPNRKPEIFAIYVGMISPLNHDQRGYLEGLPRWSWRTDADTSTLVQEVLSLLAHNQALPAPDKSTDTLPSVPPAWESPERPPLPIAEPELLREPGGQVRLDSAFYVERVPSEALCYEEILQPGAQIRIKAPRQMGKTSLMARILCHAREHGYQTVPLSFQLADSKIFTNLDQFLRWFCEQVGRRLKRLNQLDDYWNTYGSKDKCNAYFEECLLEEVTSPLVVALDEVDRIFPHREIADDFFGLLRAWYECASYGDASSKIWEKLRLVVVHSTEVYIPLDTNQSPFNVGKSVELHEFSSEQVCDLVRRHKLNWATAQVKKLMDLVGGHPYLVRLALYHIRCQHVTLEHLVQTAPTEAGIYSDHLRRHLWNLQQHPDLANAFRQVVTTPTPVELDSESVFKLHSMGLVHRHENEVTVRYDLYRRYFPSRINKF